MSVRTPWLRAFLGAAWVISPSVATAQPPFDSDVDTLYVQPATIGMGTFDTGDTIWVGLGVDW